MSARKEAILSNENKFTVFHYGGHTIRFKAPYSLERYTRVKEWDHGYLVVMAKYKHSEKEDILIHWYATRQVDNKKIYFLYCPVCAGQYFYAANNRS